MILADLHSVVARCVV